MILAGVPYGAIVRVDGRWGVVTKFEGGKAKFGFRIVDFWDGGREWVREYKAVEVLPDKRCAA